MKILTIRDVADLTRTPEATLRYWRHLGTKGPKSWLLGSRVVYTEEDVEAWLAAQYNAGPTSATRPPVT